MAETERPNLWNTIYLAATNFTNVAADDVKKRVNDILWNLKTWPQELIDWPVSNEHRVDILYDLAISRFHKAHIQSLKTRSPLPANERCQYRWNANPFKVENCGSGMSEGDPGAWLLPYWMARYYQII